MGAGCDAEASIARVRFPCQQGKEQGIWRFLGRIAPKAAENPTSFQALASKFCAAGTGNEFGRTGNSFRLILGEQGFSAALRRRKLVWADSIETQPHRVAWVASSEEAFGGLRGPF
jgi:hypothetical protein